MNLMDALRESISPYRRLILAAVLVPAVVALVISLLMPPEYLSRTSVLPVNGRLGDKLRLTGQEIAELNSVYGNGDDLDRVFAIAGSGQVFGKLVDSFQLVKHYQINGDPRLAAEKAGKRLRKQTDFKRSEYGELIIRTWDRDPVMASSLANAFVQQIEAIHLKQYERIYAETLQGMKQRMTALKDVGDSSAPGQEKTLEMYQQAVDEFTLAASHPPPAVLVVERAEVSVKADRPKPWLNTIIAAVAGLFTALLYIFLFAGAPHKQTHVAHP